MKFNLNDSVRVKLTSSGLKHLKSLPYHEYVSSKAEKNNNIHETKLWILMQDFGEHIHMGMLEVPFEGNTIEFIDGKTSH